MQIEGSLGKLEALSIPQTLMTSDGERVFSTYIRFPKLLEVMTSLDFAVKASAFIHSCNLLEVIPFKKYSWSEENQLFIAETNFPEGFYLPPNVNAAHFYSRFKFAEEEMPDCFIIGGQFYTLPEYQVKPAALVPKVSTPQLKVFVKPASVATPPKANLSGYPPGCGPKPGSQYR